MASIRNLPLRQRIVVIIMIISAAALVLSGGVLLTYDFLTERRDLLNNSATLANVVAENVAAAVAFNDAGAAVDTLASLRAEPSVVAACVYTPQGLFARYVGPGQAGCPEKPETELGVRQYVHTESAIDLNGQQLGVVHLRATLAPMYALLRLQILAIVGVLICSSLFAFLLS